MKHAAVILALSAGSAAGQTERTIMHTDGYGAAVARQVSPLDWTVPDTPVVQEDIEWHYADAVSIPASVALGNAGDESWVGHSLNDERVSKFATSGSNVPDFMYSVLSENPETVGVAAASESSRCALITNPASGPISVRWFTDANGSTPVGSFSFQSQYTACSERSIAVNADGTRVAATAYNGTDTELVLFNGTGVVLGSMTIPGFSLRIDMDDSGNRVVVTAGAVARVIDTTTMTEEYALAVSGAGGYFRISRDGSAIAAGGFNVRAAREIEGVWQQVYSGTGSQDWFGAISLSGDGLTLFAVSHDYGDGYLTNEHRIVDLSDGSVVMTSSYTGSGALQNSAIASEVNDDGTVFVAASWGDAANTQPEVRVYDRDLNIIDSLDTDGSPFALDMSSDGSHILVGCKAVHANDFGSGGDTYAFELPGSDCVADVNGDGALTPTDFTAWINAFNNNLPGCDQNGDGSCTPTDFTAWISNFNAGC
ncbi:MAG: hypothetical protein Phyf2KO_25010 [Phycisphaerales bacterium]